MSLWNLSVRSRLKETKPYKSLHLQSLQHSDTPAKACHRKTLHSDSSTGESGACFMSLLSSPLRDKSWHHSLCFYLRHAMPVCHSWQRQLQPIPEQLRSPQRPDRVVPSLSEPRCRGPHVKSVLFVKRKTERMRKKRRKRNSLQNWEKTAMYNQCCIQRIQLFLVSCDANILWNRNFLHQTWYFASENNKIKGIHINKVQSINDIRFKLCKNKSKSAAGPLKRFFWTVTNIEH